MTLSRAGWREDPGLAAARITGRQPAACDDCCDRRRQASSARPVPAWISVPGSGTTAMAAVSPTILEPAKLLCTAPKLTLEATLNASATGCTKGAQLPRFCSDVLPLVVPATEKFCGVNNGAGIDA